MAVTAGILLAIAGISAAAGIVGGAINTGINYAANSGLQHDQQSFSAEEAEKSRTFSNEQRELSEQFNAEEAQKQRAFEKMMSDTSIQRQVADARAAGINPAAVVGSSSTVPTGASASIGNPYSAQGSGSLGHVSPGVVSPESGKLLHSAMMATALQYKNRDDLRHALNTFARMQANDAYEYYKTQMKMASDINAYGSSPKQLYEKAPADVVGTMAESGELF